MQNCIFTNNSCQTGDGKNTVFVKFNANGSKFYACTFANNENSTDRTVLFEWGSGTLKNCLFWGNAGGDIGAGDAGNPPIATYCGFDSNQSSQLFYSTGCISTLTAGNTFINPTTFRGVASTEGQKTESANANWNLKTASPAIGAGSNLSGANVTTDITGVTRGIPDDLGAFKYNSIATDIVEKTTNYTVNSIDGQIILRNIPVGEKV